MHGRALAGLVAASLLGAAPASADVPVGNLLANPGAEAVPGTANDSDIVPPPGWTVESNFTAIRYGAEPGFPTVATGVAVGGGANFFAGGPSNAASAATQTVDVSVAAAEIDAGGVPATLSALLGGWEGQTDHATVAATFLNAAGAPLGTLSLQTVTAAERNSQTTLLRRSVSGAVPRATRRIAVRIDAVRDAGSYNDGYIDNVSLVLQGEPLPTFHKTVVVVVVSGKVRVRVPGSSRFVDLTGTEAVPLSSSLDTKQGVLELTSVPRAGAAPQTSKFYSGIFKVTQRGAFTQLALTEPLAFCKRAGAAAKKPKTRRLWGDGSGNFRTRGQFSSATVRGTKWLVQDSCAGTLTRVVRGVVSVRDTVRRKTIVVRAGKRYLARRRR